MRRPGLIAVCLLFCAPAMAQDTTIRQFDIPTLEKLGHDMYVQDQAAWHATDALMALHPKAELAKENVRGWIVEDRPDGELVRFIRMGDSGPEAAYDIRYRPGADFAKDEPQVSAPSDRRLSDLEKAQFSARTLALKSITMRCGDNFNTVVLKDPEGEGWLAWVLAATFDPRGVMVGGHRRLTVSADGTQVLRDDALSRGCLTLDKQPKDEDKKLVALMSVQLVSEIPVETFVFLNLQHGLPFIVVTPDRTEWGIERGTIRKIGTLPDRTAPKSP